MLLEMLTVGPLMENCYLLGDEETRQAILFDPGDEAERILGRLEAHGLTLVRILNTHGHFDHVGAVGRIQQETGVDFYLHEADLFLLDGIFEKAAAFGIEGILPPRVTHHPREGDEFTLGRISFRAIHLPGHSPGSLGYLFSDCLIGGDVLFAGSVGRTDIPGADPRQLVETLRNKVLPLDDAILVYPGHGPPTSIRQERATNPFLIALQRQGGLF
jgi:glyoxylase-like metal-dependent hydrolase (beta-lactamase superfamily II)